MRGFLSLKVDVQKAIIENCEERLPYSAKIIEKDIWVCWTLEQLFKMSGLSIVFKGGTSLSKGYNLIDRFSEDLDIKLFDNQDITGKDGVEPTRSQMDKAGTKTIPQCIKETILPNFAAMIQAQNLTSRLNLVIEDRSNLIIEYNSLFAASASSYLPERVLIEFGARSLMEPVDERIINTYANWEDIGFPTSNVTILKPTITFWEKAILIHVACNNKIKVNETKLSRQFRHWYDLYRLNNSLIKNEAIKDRSLFELALSYKEKYYKSPHYAGCTNGNFRLIPDADDIIKLKDDYTGMKSEKMFATDPVDFDVILDDLNKLEQQLRKLCYIK